MFPKNVTNNFGTSYMWGTVSDHCLGLRQSRDLILLLALLLSLPLDELLQFPLSNVENSWGYGN